MPSPDLMIKGLDDLAKEAGLDPRKVSASDGQTRINNKGATGTDDSMALARGDASGIQLDLTSIREEMEAEKAKQKRTSAVKFDDDNGVLVPQNIEEYDPLSVPGFTLPPSPTGALETLEEMQARQEYEDDEDDEEDWEYATEEHESMDDEGGALSEVGAFESDYFGAISLGESNDEE